ncbi:DHHA1 domain-containing protein [uncultured Microscilla sp.]|uniref:DHHA1 domain-containing protein n=1 Tax=uncultured Microscilla sp. TaxID=432653 RepID=UPI002621E17B|nr:DHHA1 domain-containing protein [uncultured Microscilla sp.]
MRTYVLYHAHCTDGFGAAYAVWKIYGDKAIYLPVKYDNPMPKLKHRSEVFIVDFSYPKAELLELASLMHEVTVLDHHKTAKEELGGITEGDAPNLSITFDMDKSGAVLAWEHFHPNEEIPPLILHIQDKDLWRFDLKDTKKVIASLTSYTMDFKLWDRFDLNTLITEGEAILRYQTLTVDKLCKNARMVQILDYTVPSVNSGVLQSEIGNRLCEIYPDSPFSVVHFETSDKTRYSLRSVGDFDVSLVAKEFGGGGHKNAAGYIKR